MLSGLKFENPVAAGIVLLVGMLLVYAVFAVLWTEKNSAGPGHERITPRTVSIETCRLAHTDQKQDECVRSIAVRDRNREYCSMILNESLKASCLARFSMVKNGS